MSGEIDRRAPIDPAREGLEVRRLSLARGGRAVLRGMTFDVKPGEILAIIGPNGAGKTTLLECLSGLRRSDAGEVSWRARSLEGFAAYCSVFSYMPDEVDPPAELFVHEIVADARRIGRTPDALADRLVSALAILPLMPARADALSRGERRRVALFQVLSSDRPVLVLDEPFGVFDPRQLRDVLALVRERAVAGVTVIAAVHQMSDAEKIADRLLLTTEGRVVAHGTLAELRARAGEPGASLEQLFVKLLEHGADARA